MKRLLLLGMLFCSASAFGISFGVLETDSKVGERFEARGEVLDRTGRYSKGQLNVRQLLPHEAAERGLELLSTPLPLVMSVTEDNNKLYVVVRSQRATNEPVITLPLKLSSPSGSIIQVFPVFIDFPEASSAATSTNNKHASETTLLAVSSERTATLNDPYVSFVHHTGSIYTFAKMPSFTVGRDFYRVQSGDSLSRVAEKLRDASDLKVSVNQLSRWLFEHTPQAFIRGNINSMRAGAKLWLPDEMKLSSVDEKDSHQMGHHSSEILHSPSVLGAASEVKVYEGSSLTANFVSASEQNSRVALKQAITNELDSIKVQQSRLNRDNEDLRRHLATLKFQEQHLASLSAGSKNGTNKAAGVVALNNVGINTITPLTNNSASDHLPSTLLEMAWLPLLLLAALLLTVLLLSWRNSKHTSIRGEGVAQIKAVKEINSLSGRVELNSNLRGGQGGTQNALASTTQQFSGLRVADSKIESLQARTERIIEEGLVPARKGESDVSLDTSDIELSAEDFVFDGSCVAQSEADELVVPTDPVMANVIPDSDEEFDLRLDLDEDDYIPDR